MVDEELDRTEEGHMYPIELAGRPVECPECGCADVEHVGKQGGHHRYLCLEGHRFEVPKPPGFLARWSMKRRSAGRRSPSKPGPR